MSDSPQNAKLTLPSSLENQLHDFRRRVWKIKAIEAVCGGLFGVVISYLAVFVLDRLFDTPTWARVTIFLAAVAACSMVPVYLHRWIWCNRRLDQLARLLSRRFPSLGDQMLGIIELVRNELEQSRSRALVQAAIHQVAEVASRKDFRDVVPAPRHRLWAWMAGVPAATAILLLAIFPSAATNAWARFAAPWSSTARYTFTQVDKLNDKLVVPHGEPVSLPIKLAKDSPWHPSQGTAKLGSQHPVKADLKDGSYDFELPPQIDKGVLDLQIGDSQQRTRVEPMLRPELTHVVAEIKLPDYLNRNESLQRDVRGGALTVVNGSTTRFTVSANRNLTSTKWSTPDSPDEGQNEVALAAPSATVSSPGFELTSSQKVQLEWQDEYGLKGKEPLTVNINARDDEAPSISCEDLPRHRVVIDSETLTFSVRVQDDFGIKVVGIEWVGTDKVAASKLAKGEKVLGAGGSDKESLELTGTFCAKTLEIEPQPLSVRLYAEDYLPGRQRVYSQPYILYVLTAEQHSIWLTEQLNKWHKMSLEVRDRELQLHHTNQELRMLSEDQLDQPENRRRIEAQSAAERSNGRRLNGLVLGGEELVRQAMRNPEFGVGHLEKWAEMLQILKDISGNRMPNVADLLKQSSQAPAVAAANQSPKPAGPMAGQNRTPAGGNQQQTEDSKPKPPTPTVADGESSQNQGKKPDGQPEEPGKSKSNSALRLPVTTVMSAPNNKKPDSPAPAAAKLDEAVKAQQDLLAEFDKIAEELNKVLANLEGSTLVKRLKAASRKQYVIAGKIGDQVSAGFGFTTKASDAVKGALKVISKDEEKSSQDLSMIMDDMQAYFERRHLLRYKTVLDEMRAQDAVGSLRQLGDDLPKETGISIAQAEFWSDTFDRWADDLVDPACSGKCPGCKSKASLPPSIVLEAMQILEAEVNLREETRVADQAKPALAKEEYNDLAKKLATTQEALAERVVALAERIRELPDGDQEFAPEIKLLGQVDAAMDDATELLEKPSTGSDAIGAETEAIELLLKSKKINPKGGGGGGSSPGGGGTGTTSDVALALVGSGVNEKEIREDRGVSQATGDAGTSLPEEFRAGLDEYFNRLERDASKQ